ARKYRLREMRATRIFDADCTPPPIGEGGGGQIAGLLAQVSRQGKKGLGAMPPLQEFAEAEPAIAFALGLHRGDSLLDLFKQCHTGWHGFCGYAGGGIHKQHKYKPQGVAPREYLRYCNHCHDSWFLSVSW